MLATATLVAASFLVGAGVAHADPAEPPVVPSLEPAKTQQEWSALVRSPRIQPGAAPEDCRPLRAVFYTATDWLRLTTKLAANPSPCAQYYISIPPLTSDKSQPRGDQAWRIRALGPSFHAMAEMNITGWTNWVANNGGSWYDAGVEARRRMANAGYDVGAGDIWALNELSSAVRQGSGNARANMRDFMRGLYDGGGSVPAVRGAVFVSGLSQATSDVSVYQARLQDWFDDAPFWADMSTYVVDWSQELYGDFRNYGVAGSSLPQRRDSLNDYLQHELLLANAGPDSAAAARSFLQSAYSPLANAAWEWDSAFGWTAVPFDQMEDYVSAQTYALRYASASAAQDHAGFPWAPKNLVGLPASDFAAQTAAVQERLAAAIHDSAQTVDPSDPGVGACAPTGVNQWCVASIDGAWFNTAWQALATWRPSLIAFTTPPQSLTAGTTSAPMTVQLQTSTHVPLTAMSPLQVTLASNSGKGRFAPSPSGPWTSTLDVTIAVNTSTSPPFYYRDKLAGAAALTASATDKQSGTQTESVAPAAIATLKISPKTATVAPGGTRTFTAKGADAYGNAVATDGASWSVIPGTLGSVSPATGASTTFTASSTPGNGSVVATVSGPSGPITASSAVTVTGAAAASTTATVSSIEYARQGQDLLLALTIVDATGAPVAGAVASFSVARTGAAYASGTVTTTSDGRATFTLPSAPSGCYSTTITAVTATGYDWDANTPANQLCF